MLTSSEVQIVNNIKLERYFGLELLETKWLYLNWTAHDKLVDIKINDILF